MSLKRCKKCQQEKPSSEYYRHRKSRDGLDYLCKECSRGKAREWQRSNPERHAEASARWDRENIERKRELRRESYRRHRAAQMQRSKARRDEEPEKYRARYTLTNAVREGKIAKPSACEDCGKELSARLIHGHHHDYSKPLEVEWLCAPCHATRHGD